MVVLTIGSETLRPALPRVRYSTIAVVDMVKTMMKLINDEVVWGFEPLVNWSEPYVWIVEL
jgi:hypothetical protein